VRVSRKRHKQDLGRQAAQLADRVEAEPRYFYGGHASSSTIGERLADLAQRELVARTGMLDGRIHGKTWSILRLTRMPAVRIEVGYLSSPGDRNRLVDPSFRDTVAEGLLVAVQRLYLPKADDPTTGVMRIPLVGSGAPSGAT
jgi:N-acetylmuramoyl-L-alanine amidase